MAEQYVLQATNRRERGKENRLLRKTDIVPAVVYGHGVENLSVALVYNEFKKLYEKAGSSSIVSLQIDADKYDVLVHEVKLDPVTDRYFHVDFLRIKRDEKIETKVAVEVVGESRVVKELNGIVVTALDELGVRCFPQDLIPKFEIDISKIENFNQPIHVKDIKVPDTIEMLNDPEAVVVTIVPPRKEEEEAPAVEVQLIPEELKAQQEAAAAAASQEQDKEGKKEK